jgi:type II secretory pathway component PulJ
MKVARITALNHRVMKTQSSFVSHIRHASLSRAFSLIEILITVGLLSFIILGLLLMFNQVQRAFRSSMTQTDVMESGRAVMDMLVRDLEETAPWQLPYSGPRNLDPQHYSLNFFVSMTGDFSNPLLQDLPGTTKPGVGPYRNNVIEQFCFTSRSNQSYTLTGYRVLSDYTNPVAAVPPLECLGALYRYTVTTNKNWAPYLGTNFFVASRFTTNMHRIADGIVHLQVRVFDTNGAPMFANTTNSLAFWSFTNVVGGLGRPQVTTVPVKNAFATNDWPTAGQPIIPNQQYMEYWFYSNAVPAYVELELGIVEPHTLDRFKAIAEADVGAARNYLASRAAHVHVFRQRIPIRAVDYMAYR